MCTFLLNLLNKMIKNIVILIYLFKANTIIKDINTLNVCFAIILYLIFHKNTNLSLIMFYFFNILPINKLHVLFNNFILSYRYVFYKSAICWELAFKK